MNAERSLCLGRRGDREQSTEDTCHGDEVTQRFPVPPMERQSPPRLARNLYLVRTDVVRSQRVEESSKQDCVISAISKMTGTLWFYKIPPSCQGAGTRQTRKSWPHTDLTANRDHADGCGGATGQELGLGFQGPWPRAATGHLDAEQEAVPIHW